MLFQQKSLLQSYFLAFLLGFRAKHVIDIEIVFIFDF